MQLFGWSLTQDLNSRELQQFFIFITCTDALTCGDAGQSRGLQLAYVRKTGVL